MGKTGEHFWDAFVKKTELETSTNGPNIRNLKIAMTLDEARSLIKQNRIHEAFVMLQKLRTSANPPPGAWLEWAGLATVTPFSYLAVDAARKEVELFQSSAAKEFLGGIESALRGGRDRSSKDYPPISLIGHVSEGSESLWLRCIDSIGFQFNSSVEVILISRRSAAEWGALPSFVTLRSPQSSPYNPALELEHAIRASRGEVISVIDNPSAVFSDHGLVLVGATFKTLPQVTVMQTERMCYGFEGVATPVRIEIPMWSQAILLDPLCLEPPTLYFSWRGAFIRKKTLLEEVLPFSPGVLHATAYEAAVKIARNHLIHTVRAPVVFDDTPLEARSFQVPLIELSEARQIIAREQKLLQGAPRTNTPELIEIAPQPPNFHSFPRVAPFILIHGEKAAPPITLVTAVYNGADYLERCMDSVLSQNYPNLEYIVLDGGSSDGSTEIIKKYEKHLNYWRSSPDGGHYAAIQEGLLRSKGSIMSWLNADDLLTPYTLRLVASVFSERKDVHWITGKFCMTSVKNDIDIGRSIPIFAGDNYFEDCFDRPFIQQEGTFWRRSLWDAAGGTLDLRLELAADMELWTRFFQLAKLISLSVPLGVFMRRKGQRSEAFQNKYYHEAYGVTQRLKADGKKPYSKNPGESLRMEIPLEQEQLLGNTRPSIS